MNSFRMGCFVVLDNMQCCNPYLSIIFLFCNSSNARRKNEPPHDKTNKMTVRPAKTQISLGIRPVWSESSLSAWRKLGSLATHWAHSEDTDQTGRMPRLIWVFAGRTCHFAGFVTRRLKCFLPCLGWHAARAWSLLRLRLSLNCSSKDAYS